MQPLQVAFDSQDIKTSINLSWETKSLCAFLLSRIICCLIKSFKISGFQTCTERAHKSESLHVTRALLAHSFTLICFFNHRLQHIWAQQISTVEFITKLVHLDVRIGLPAGFCRCTSFTVVYLSFIVNPFLPFGQKVLPSQHLRLEIFVRTWSICVAAADLLKL